MRDNGAVPYPVSVQICTLNEAANIGPCLESVWANDPAEVIVIDGGSSDRTVGIAESMGARAALDVDPEVTYQDSPFGWPGDVPRYEFDTSKMRREGFAIDTTSRAAVRRAAEDLNSEWSTT